VYAGDGHDAHWGYSGDTGPKHWGSLSEKYSACDSGKQHSPIDIATSTKADLPPLQFNYSSFPLAIINNGHTIGIETKGAGSLTIGNDSYNILGFHSHSPTEGAIDGKHADMVMHLVHKSEAGKIAVVAVYFNKGEANPLITTLWNVMPKQVGEVQHHNDIKIDIKQILPEDSNYYTYAGSFTTPPCTEGVKWIVLKQQVTISAEQLAQYNALYSDNVRPVQPLNERKVLSSN
ncbi:MAG: carbonic anhydrase family protein, partial [Proteobacteria bacterium]|nr:carbonic anhydrase family protein [Pseudomonadota bacterium]